MWADGKAGDAQKLREWGPGLDISLAAAAFTFQVYVAVIRKAAGGEEQGGREGLGG